MQTPINAKKLINDPVYFVEKIIKGHHPSGNLVQFQKDWLKISKKHKRLVFMAFRSSGKTSQLIINDCLWHAVTKPGTKYIIISRTLPQAIEILKDMKTVILACPLLNSVVPNNKSQSWSKSEIELKNGSRIMARAYNENVRGLHVDGVYADEMGEYGSHDVLKKAIMPMLRAKGGFFKGLGTPKSELDLLHAIETEPGFSAFHFDRWPAEGEKGDLFVQRYPHTKIIHEQGKVSIIDNKTNETIETYDTLTWSQEFLLKPVSTSDKLFPEHMVAACVDQNLTFYENPVNMRQYFMGVDFAMSAQSGSDYTVITVLEKAPGDKKLKIVWIERFKGMDYTFQKEKIKELAKRYQVIKILGDESSFGKVFISDLMQDGMPIQGMAFSGANNNKTDIIKALRDQFEQQGFLIPRSPDDAKTKITVDALLDELNKFGIIFDINKKAVTFQGLGKHDDMVISLALANFIARHISMGIFSVIKGSDSGRFNPFAVA